MTPLYDRLQKPSNILPISVDESTENYTVDRSQSSAVNLPKVKFSFRRIVVVLGANGTGKSRLIIDMKQECSSLFHGRRAIYVDGARIINVPLNVSLDGNTRTPQQAYESYSASLSTAINTRIHFALQTLEARSVEVAKSFHLNFRKRRESGESVEEMEASKFPIDIFINAFSDIFPDIILSIDEQSRKILCTKAGTVYGTQQLSDGEKQVFCLLADAILEIGDSVVFADEPELNLHPLLASRLWDTLERLMPNSLFVYATHSINFALRPSVDTIIVLKKSGCEVLNPSDLLSMDKESLSDFLGAIPAVLSAERVIGIEGENSSFDQQFYSLFVDPSVRIVPLGSCNDVVAATTKTGIWESISAGVKLVGVIDRDYMSDDQVNDLSRKVIVLDFHEAESYLCHPDVFVPIMNQFSESVDGLKRKVNDCICEYFEEQMWRVVSKRISRKFEQFGPSLSIPRKDIASVTSVSEFENAFRSSARQDRDRIIKMLENDKLDQVIADEVSLCQRALDSRAADQILKIVEGKELIKRLLKLTKFSDETGLIDVVRKNDLVKSIPILKDLRDRIQIQLNAT